MKGRLAFILMAGLMWGFSTANAAPIINSAGLTSPANTLGFDGLGGNGVLVVNQFASLGVVFGGTPLYTLASGEFAGMDSFALNNGGTFQILFQGTVSEAAFAFMTNAGVSTFTALLNGTVVEQFSASTAYAFDPAAATFFGFSGITFDTLQVAAGGQGGAFRLDNLEYGSVTSSVPEPGTLAIFGLGLVGLGLMRRRKRAA